MIFFYDMHVYMYTYTHKTFFMPLKNFILIKRREIIIVQNGEHATRVLPLCRL